MAFYRKTKLNRGTKENPVLSYIPRAVLVGKQITTKELSKRIAAESTASEADVRAVLTALPGVMGMYMSLGRSVKLDGIGSFQYTIGCKGNEVDSPDKVSTSQITDVRVRFQPERTFTAGHSGMTRAMVDSTNGIEWIDIDSLLATDDENPTPTPTPSGSVAAPTISGTTPFETSTSVTMSGPTGAEIRYTTDGSTPTSSSSLYSSAITLSATTTVKAIAIKDGVSSEVTTKTFTKSGGGGDAD